MELKQVANQTKAPSHTNQDKSTPPSEQPLAHLQWLTASGVNSCFADVSQWPLAVLDKRLLGDCWLWQIGFSKTMGWCGDAWNLDPNSPLSSPKQPTPGHFYLPPSNPVLITLQLSNTRKTNLRTSSWFISYMDDNCHSCFQVDITASQNLWNCWMNPESFAEHFC